MSKRLVFSVVFTVCFLACIGVIASLSSQTAPSSAPETAATEPSTQSHYIIKDFYGKVAVFKSDSNEPIEITDTSTATLPEFDRTQLKSGISVNDDTSLRRLLEDYCS